MKYKIGLTLAGAVLAMGMNNANAVVKWDMSNEYSSTSIHGEGDSYFVKHLVTIQLISATIIKTEPLLYP